MSRQNLMRMSLVSSVLALAVPLSATQADDIDFNGTLTNECTLALTNAGVLAMSSDGTVLSSQEAGGVAAVMTVVSIGSNTLTVNAPTVVSAPGSHNGSGETVEVSYSGASGLSGVSQTMTDQTTNHALGAVPLSALTIHTRITNSNSFAAGDYTIRSVVTCS